MDESKNQAALLHVETGAIGSNLPDAFDVAGFFEALPTDPERSISLIRSQVPDDGRPSPRASAYIDTGEWDDPTLVTIVFISSDSCFGDVGKEKNHLLLRFCGLSVNDCKSSSHEGVKWASFSAGWYIPGGTNKRFGYYKSPFIPSAERGGPITSTIAAVLKNTADPFVMSRGMWKFVFDEWSAQTSQFGGSPSSGFAYVDAAAAPSANPEDKDSDDDLATPRLPASSFFTSSLDKKPMIGGGLFSPQQASVIPPPGQSPRSAVGTSSAKVFLKPPPATNPTVTGKKKAPIVVAPVAPGQPAPTTANISQPGALSSRVVYLEKEVNLAVQRQRDAEARIADLELALAAVQPSSNLESRVFSLEQTEGRLQDAINDLKQVCYHPGGALNLLAEQLAAVKRHTQVGQAVQRHGAHFSHPSDISSMLRVLKGAIGLFQDPVTLLHSIGAETSTHRDTLSEMKAQRDVKIGTDLDARVITSFRTNLPAILYGGSTTTDSAGDFVTLISRLKTYEQWHNPDGVSGVAQWIVQGMNEIQSRVGFLASQLTTDPGILRLSNGLCNDSVNFVQWFISFIDSTHAEYTLASFLSNEQVWELCVAYIEIIFKDMRRKRCLIQDASEQDTSILLWGILKCHEVADEYMKHEFRRHPSLNATLVQKILRCSPVTGDSHRLNSLESAKQSLDGKVSGLKLRMQAVEAKTARLPEV